MSERTRRSLLFWLGLGAVLSSDLFLFWYPIPKKRASVSLSRSKRIRTPKRYSTEENDDVLFESNEPGFEAEEEEELEVEAEVVSDEERKYFLLYDIVQGVRRVFFFLLFTNLIANELSYLYCDGHTVVLSYIATRIGKKLVESQHYGAAYRLFLFSMYWNRLWLSPSNQQLSHNYTDLAVVSGLLKNRRNFQFYSKLLAELKFEHRKKVWSDKLLRISTWFSKDLAETT